MPRLPRVLLDQGVAAPQGPMIPYQRDTTAGAILGVGQAISGALTQMADLEREKKRIAVNQEVSLLHADAELQIGAADVQLRATERDPDAYTKQYEALVQRVQEDVAKQAKYPESATALTVKLAPTLARHKVEAFKHANTLYVDRGVANLETTLDSRKTLAGAAVDDEEFSKQYQEGEAAITAAVPIIGANKAGDMRRQFREDTLEARALKEAHDDPQGFAETADTRYRLLNPKTREQMVEAAKRRAIENQKETDRVQDRLDAKMEKINEKERQMRLTGLVVAATDRQLTRQQVIDARDRGDLVNPTEVEHFLTLATKQNTAESDPAIWNAVQADVWGPAPSYTEARIQALMARHAEGGAGLNGEHGRMTLIELGRKRDHDVSEGRTQENQQRERHKDAYLRAKEEMLRALGITTPMSQLDKKEAKLASEAEREYNARVLDRDGNVRTDVAPRDAMLEMLPIFQARQDADARLDYKNQAAIVADLVGSTPPDFLDQKFEEWYAQQVRATDTLQNDPRTIGLFKLRRGQLLQLRRKGIEILQAEVRRLESSKKSTGGYKPPGEN